MIATSDGTYTQTDHGLLVALGEFLQQHGLLKQMMILPIHQKTRTNTPQAKVIEFMAVIFSGIEYLSDLNNASHPLAKDETVARAWGLTSFAHHSGVSRTLDTCNNTTVLAARQAMEAFNHPFIRTTVAECLHADRLDGVYGQRWKTETVHSVIKRKFGDTIRSRSLVLQSREAIVKALVYNLHRLLLSFALYMFATEQGISFNLTMTPLRNRSTVHSISSR